jgi:hypothetical protein
MHIVGMHKQLQLSKWNLLDAKMHFQLQVSGWKL